MGPFINHYPWGGINIKKTTLVGTETFPSQANCIVPPSLILAVLMAGLAPSSSTPGLLFFWADHVNITGRFWDAPLNYVSGWPSRVATTSFHKGPKAWVGHFDFR